MKLDISLPVSVENISVAGNNRTRPEYFGAEFSERKFSNFVEFQSCVHDSVNRIRNNGSFEAANADICIKEVKDGNFLVDVNILVKEKGIPFLKAESYVRTGTTSNNVGCELQGALRSPLGFGETVKLSLGTSYSGAKERYLSLNVPNVSSVRGDLNVTFKSADQDNSYFLTHKQHVESLSIEGVSRDHKHRVELELSSRDDIPALGSYEPARNWTDGRIKGTSLYQTRATNPEILEQATKSTKSSLKYSQVVTDTRDSKCVPTAGHYLTGSVEVAAGLGEAQFVKAELQSQVHTRIGPTLFGQPGLSFSLCGNIGLVAPLPSLLLLAKSTSSDNTAVTVNQTSSGFSSSSPHFVHLSDRFHLGGPLSLRGFEHYGVDPSPPNSISNTTTAQWWAGRASVSSVSSSSASLLTRAKSFLRPLTLRSSAVLSNPDGSTASNNNNNNNNNNPSNDLDSSNNISLGGCGRASLVAMLTAPVPIESLAAAGARSMFYVTAGSLGRAEYWAQRARFSHANSSGGNSNSSFRESPFGGFRIAMGGGLVIPLANTARVEITYSVPLVKAPQDVSRGFQLGVGLNII